MTSPLFVVVFALVAFVVTSTTGKDAVKNVDLAEELEKSRQALEKSHQESEKLHQALEKSHQESEKSRQALEKSHQESEKLRQQLEKSQEETKEVFKQMNKKLRSEDKKLRKENKKLRRQDEELRKEDAKLKRRVHELHQDNSEIKNSLRQRDQNNTLELQNVVRSSFRNMDSSSEFKKMVYKIIEGYLDENKICVTGDYRQGMDDLGTGVVKRPKIEFGQTFRRIPAFAAALSYAKYKTAASQGYAYAMVNDFHVTYSSADIKIQATACYDVYVNWIACLWSGNRGERSEI